MSWSTPSPAELGHLKSVWTNGYNGQKSYFIDNTVIVYPCGSSIKFFDLSTNKTETFSPKCLEEEDNTNGICLVTATTALNKFAYSDTKLWPSIYVHDHPNRELVSTLTEGAEIEYLEIEFSNSEILLAMTNVPEMDIVIWNWKTASKIGRIPLDPSLGKPDHLLFSPINWRNLVVAYKTELTLWSMEVCDTKRFKTSKISFCSPPIGDQPEKGIFMDHSDEFNISIRAITNCDESLIEKIDQALDTRKRHELQTLTFTNNENELILVTKNNFIFKCLLSDKTIKCIYDPTVETEPFSIDSSFQILDLKYHKRVLFAACSDNQMRLLDGSELFPHQKKNPKLGVRVRECFYIPSTSFSNCSLNQQFDLLAVSTDRGVYCLNNPSLLQRIERDAIDNDTPDPSEWLVIDFDEGRTVAIANVNPYGQNFVALKENGCLQIWNTRQNYIVSRLQLNTNCTTLASHSKMGLLVAGTASGHLVFIDLSNEKEPRLVEKCRVHAGAVKLLKFNTSGTMLFSVGDDGKLFVIDTRLSVNVQKILVNNDQRLTTNNTPVNGFEKGFHILGYIEFEGEAVCFDLFDTLTSEITTKVAIGIYDNDNWEIIKKVIDDVLPNSESINIRSDKSEKGDSKQPDQSDQTILLNNTQMKTVVPRLDYRNTERRVEYVETANQKSTKLACKVIFFEISLNMFVKQEKPEDMYHSIRLNLKNEAIKLMTSHSYFLFSDLVLTSMSSIAASTDRFISLFKTPEFDPVKLKTSSTKFSYLELLGIVGTHDFGFSCFTRSQNNKFVASGGYDGSLTVRKSGDLKSFVENRVSHYNNGGIESVIFHSDGAGLIALGHDNTIINVTWNCTFEPSVKLIHTPPITGDYDRTSLTELAANAHSHQDGDLTWYQVKEKEFFVEQDKEFLPIKKNIIAGLEDIRKKLRQLMNDNAERDDLAKLKEAEFYLDLDELDRLHKETETEIANIRERTELDDLSKLYVRDAIKKECWDKMSVKGRGIQAFNTSLLVENYPLKERTRDEVNLLERVQMLRKIEISAQKTGSELCYDMMKKDNINEFIENSDDDKDSSEPTNNQQVANNYLTPNLIPLSFKGSIGSLFGGDSNLFYSQFQMFTVEQKYYQIILVQDAIFRIKSNFNVEFELMMDRKNQEISKIKEKNQRLKQIYIDLSEDTVIPEPRFGDAENPELLFEVSDEEVTVEKYLTPEQQKAADELEAELVRKRELEKTDNWRERGLFDMMGGVLQIRREDELKKDIPRPSFSLEKIPEEWTLEETKLYAIYEQKCKELEEERDKLQKQLNAEILKIKEQILECYQNFDNQLLNLHLRKVKTQQAVYQEELKIVRLFNNIIVDSELETNEKQMTSDLEKAREEKKALTLEIQQVKKFVETFKEEYDIACAEDKAQDRAFMREFSDVYPVTTREQLLKLYKKRAKQRMVTSKTITNPPIIFVPEYGSDNPFSDRPSTAQQLDIYSRDTEVFLAELDDIENSPGVENYIWERFVAHRREKIIMENNLKIQGLTLSEMVLYLQKRTEEEETKRRELEQLTQNLVTCQETRLRAAHNLQVQVLMKQGQVEINPGVYVHNFSDCLLIDRDVVESLNKVIQHYGSQKIAIMVDCKDYKKDIRQLEWEHKKMKMTIEDFIQKQRDVTYLKLTREIQQYLENPDYEANKQKEIATLEQTIAYKTHQNEKVYAERARKVKDIKKSSIKVANVNDQFDDKLKVTNVVLHDRKHIKEEMSGKNIDTVREEKFQQIIQRRKLVDLAKAQAQEVAFLRSEVERLRMKTFPALVQIEF